jgi:predicted 3-demethylubiquinone-9 3-methyltransferase (glyoxalase superfamily)
MPAGASTIGMNPAEERLSMQRVSTCLGCDDQAEEAVGFYTSLFPNSRVIDTTYYIASGRS